jgi:hydrogenase/urease accessory protein HupE
MRPAIATITINQDSSFSLTFALNIEAVIAGIEPRHQDTNDSPNAAEYERLRALEPEALTASYAAERSQFPDNIDISFDGQRSILNDADIDIPAIGNVQQQRITTLTFAGNIPPGAKTLTWRYSAALGSSAVRINIAGSDIVQSTFLDPGEQSEPFPIGSDAAPKPFWQVSLDYIVLGFTHIVPKGLDHILFVLGIFLLSQRWRPLLLQVTAFTIAHSITLGLSLYGFISLSPSVVEPLIALSIVYVGVENVLTSQLKPWRVVVVFCFGLLHGMGFAGVLTELGLPRANFLNALISFNVGVELGQLTVISLAFLGIALWFRDRAWYRSRITIPASVAIALVGGWWTIERIL